MDNAAWKAITTRINKLKSKCWNDSSDICFWLIQVGMNGKKPDELIHNNSSSFEVQCYKAAMELEQLRDEITRLKPYATQIRYWLPRIKRLQYELRKTYDLTWRLGICKTKEILHPDVEEFLLLDLELEYDNEHGSFSKNEKLQKAGESRNKRRFN